jgi:uncharacterized membrane protein YbhN (UPF0104 family)
MSRRALRVLVGVVVLGVALWRVGAGPVLDAVSHVGVWSVVFALLVAVPSTVCAAWRWRVVARGLGVEVPLRTAVASYYRSQLLNATVPGGVVGDVHRGWRHGRDAGLRAVVWERASGQAVQLAVTLVVLAAVPRVLPSLALPLVVGGLLVAVCVVLACFPDVRRAVLVRGAWPVVLVTSLVAVAGHAGTFLVAARAAGVHAPPSQLLPLALLALLAMSVPFNVVGFGPREGVAAWSFAAVGPGAEQGVATAVVYGVLSLVAVLPGLIVLLADTRRRARPLEVAHG